MLGLYLCLILSYSANINCGDTSCTFCTSGYLYNTQSCLPLCPTGYIQSASPNICTAGASQNIFFLDFWGFREFGATAIGNFQHPTGLKFQDSARLSPIPTLERGFYFASTSKLKSTVNYVIGPDLTLRLFIKVKANGTILEGKSQGITYFKLAAESGAIVIYWYLTSTSGSSTFQFVTFNYSVYWENIILNTSQTTGLFALVLNDDSLSISDNEFRGQLSDLVIWFGSDTGTSVTGFIFEIYADNLVTTEYWTVTVSSCAYCEFNQYCDDNGNCINCSGCSSSWPWCISSTCSLCYSTTCSACSGFKYSHCTQCNNGMTAPNCNLGKNCLTGTSIFSCSTCASGFSLIGGLCLYPPYGYNSATLLTPVIDITFNYFAKYYAGIFQNGANANTWGPFNNPESDDPIPVYSRGLYFDGIQKILQSTVNVNLNYKFSISFWMYPKAGALVSNDFFYIHCWSILMLRVSNPGTTWMLPSNAIFEYEDEWVFEGVSVDYLSELVTVKFTIGSTTFQVLSIDGFAFYDSNSIMQIGTGPGFYYYLGFIYRITIWQTSISDFSSQYDTCGTGLGLECVWDCPITQYYNSYLMAYKDCDTNCNYGCSRWGTCEMCLNSDCDTCTFFTDTCTSNVADPCLSNLDFRTTKNCCDSSCEDCYEPFYYSCTACSGSYLLGQVCISACPIGYSVTGSVCTTSLQVLLDLQPDAIEDQVTDSISGILFSTGTDLNFYPTGTSTDPIPAMQRGYYFKSTSYMSSEAISLPYNFTMVFYVKHLATGTLLSKNSLSIKTTPSVVFTITSVITATFASITSTNWLIMAFNLWTGKDGDTTCSLEYPPNTSNFITVANTIFLDTVSVLTLGAASGGFVGFLYKFQIFLYQEIVSSFTITICNNDSETNCLWDCGIDYFLIGSTCTPCSVSCTKGCRRPSDCDLCADQLCNICNSFTGVCTTCITNASLNINTCECDARYYWDGNVCSLCDPSCLTCSGPGYNECITCIANSEIVSISECSCLSGFYWTGASCLPCDATCKDCTGSSSITCTDCYANATLQIDNSCTCDLNYYWTGSQCDNCDPTCLQCTGTLSTQCTQCQSNASLQFDSSCLCDLSYIWIINECAPCYPSCLTCSGTEINQCLICNSGLAIQPDYTCACGEYLYWDTDLYSCQNCHGTCYSCIGPGENQCILCKSNASLVNEVCICDDGYYMDASTCKVCDQSCENCNGPEYYHCTSCINFLVDVVCISNCPIGFVGENHKCIENNEGEIMKFVFDTIQGVFYDRISNVSAVTGISERNYPTLDLTDPIPSYQRGIYFTGAGSFLAIPYQLDAILLFGIRFSISTWFLPISPTFTLYQDSLFLFTVSMTNFYVSLTVNINTKSYSLTSPFLLNKNYWNHLFISIDYSGCPTLIIGINDLPTEFSIAIEAPFMYVQNNTLYLGSTSYLQEYYKGFIWSIGFFAFPPDFTTLFITNCSSCSICETSGLCLPICNINEYYSETYEKCIDCLPSCSNGCRNSENCNLCEDSNCLSCSSFDEFSCNLCEKKYQVQNLTCVACKSNEYYVESYEKCMQCQGLCLTCKSKEKCNTCIENSSFNNGKCFCDKGYSGTISCIRNTFSAYLSITAKNEITITFTEPLEKLLSKEDLKIMIQSSFQEYNLTYIDLSTYLVNLTLAESLKGGEKLLITFRTKIISIENSELESTTLSIKLFASNYNDIVSKISMYKYYAQIGIAIGVSISLGTSVLNANLNSFFTFLNSAEIYSYILLYQVEVDPILKAFLGELRVNLKIPNLFSYLIDPSLGVEMNDKIKWFGNDTNLILLNSGVNTTVLVILLCLHFGIYLLKKINNSWLNAKLENPARIFKFNAYFRFWIQSFLEIMLNASIGVYYIGLQNPLQICNFAICICFLVIFT